MLRDRPLLVLIDGHALIHRAYHALPPLAIAKTAEPVGAVYGFVSMLLKVFQELKPSHYALAFDRPGPTFRHLQYEEYKAQRPAAPDELRGQFQRVRQVAEAFHIPAFEAEGFEADDVLAALAKQATAKGMDTIIVTGDADTIQLVSPSVRVLMPKARERFSDTVTYDEAAVWERYGLRPDQIPDLKGLKGDPSDNIPGVPGIGDKTALKLLQQFGSLEGIYQHLEEVTPPKLQERLREYEALARQSKELATLVSEVPVTLDLESCSVKGYDRDQVVILFRELEFSKLLERLPEMPSGEVGAGPPLKREKTVMERDYHQITTAEELEGMVHQLSGKPFLVVDVETTSLSPTLAELVGLAFCGTPGQAYYVPVGHRAPDGGPQLPLPQALERLKPLLEDPQRPKVTHNGKYDAAVLAKYGINLHPLTFDTMIAAYLLGEKALGLKPLAFSKLGIEMTPITALIGTGPKQKSMAGVSPSIAAEYACADADITAQLEDLLEKELQVKGLWELFTKAEMPLLPVLMRMEQHGVLLDTERLRQMSRGLGEQVGSLEGQIYDQVGHRFNINSPQQLASVLYDELHLPHPRRTKSGYSTEAAVLEELKGVHEVVKLLLEYRQLAKLKSTYIDALPALVNPQTGRVHTSFNQTGTTTGRLSSSDPNLQNIPIRTELGKQVRRAFIAPPGHRLLGADYSQIDLRVLAHLSQDPGLLAAFHRDEDIHKATASQVFGVSLNQVTAEMRRVAKTVNFGVIYGMSDYGLEQATDLSREEASRFIEAYFEKYPGVKIYLEATKQQARELGYVQTLLGRRRYIPEIRAANAQARAAAERMAINMPVQGTSADIVKLAMIQVQERMDREGLRSKMILQVHDELVFEVPEAELEAMARLAREVMSQALLLSVPLKVDLKVGQTWGDME